MEWSAFARLPCVRRCVARFDRPSWGSPTVGFPQFVDCGDTGRVQEFELPRRPEESTSDAIADRLDALQMDAVERVLRRAIELQSDEDLGPDTFDGETIKRIAGELGIDADHVEQALFEEQVGDRVEALGVMERLLAPSRMSGSTTVAAPRHHVEAAATTWLERHEGLRMRRTVPDGALWERDPSALTKIRMGLKLGRGSGALRTTGGVAHRIHTTRSGEQLVGLEVDTRIIGKTAKGLLAAGTGVGVLALVAMGIVLGWAEGAAVGLTSLAAFGTAAVVTARTWTSRVRRGIRRALDAIASPGVAGVHATVVDRISKAIRQWGDLEREVKRRR